MQQSLVLGSTTSFVRTATRVSCTHSTTATAKTTFGSAGQRMPLVSAQLGWSHEKTRAKYFVTLQYTVSLKAVSFLVGTVLQHETLDLKKSRIFLFCFCRDCGAKRPGGECEEVLNSLQKRLDEAAADPKIGTATFYEKVGTEVLNRRE